MTPLFIWIAVGLMCVALACLIWFQYRRDRIMRRLESAHARLQDNRRLFDMIRAFLPEKARAMAEKRWRLCQEWCQITADCLKPGYQRFMDRAINEVESHQRNFHNRVWFMHDEVVERIESAVHRQLSADCYWLPGDRAEPVCITTMTASSNLAPDHLQSYYGLDRSVLRWICGYVPAGMTYKLETPDSLPQEAGINPDLLPPADQIQELPTHLEINGQELPMVYCRGSQPFVVADCLPSATPAPVAG